MRDHAKRRQRPGATYIEPGWHTELEIDIPVLVKPAAVDDLKGGRIFHRNAGGLRRQEGWAICAQVR